MPRIPSLLTVPLAALVAVASLGCDNWRTPQATPSSSPLPVPSSVAPTLPIGGPAPTPTRTAAPRPTFGEVVASPCLGYPTAEQVVAVLRRTDVLPSGATVSVVTQPQCSLDWQYTVVSVPAREPLQVVTRGTPTSLTLITAGTDVCTIPVRTRAPQGITDLAHCVIQ